MSGRCHRASAIVALIALVGTVPLERFDRCDVCPTDCPMHATDHGQTSGKDRQHHGCHHQDGRPSTAATSTARCVMRAGCGHHHSSTLNVVHAELPLSPLRIGIEVRRVAIVVPSAHGIDVSASQLHPPESVVV